MSSKIIENYFLYGKEKGKIKIYLKNKEENKYSEYEKRVLKKQRGKNRIFNRAEKNGK